jgi:hypothetical protein
LKTFRARPAKIPGDQLDHRVRYPAPLIVNCGGADFLERDLVEAFQDVPDEKLQAEFRAVNKTAADELRNFSQASTF